MKEEVTFFERQFVLTTYINEDGIYIRVFPFFLKPQYFSWDIITKAYVRKYRPIKEYGGWGVNQGGFRFNIFRIQTLRFHSLWSNNVAYNMSGNMGLQLELNNGKRVLIGTRKPVEVESVLRKLKKWNE
jgi:hypothetical protein